MTDRNLRKMNRKELLELLIALEEENNRLKEQLQQQAVKLHNRDIQARKAGSLAEAALTLNGVFADADKAAEQYLENIQRYSELSKRSYEKIVSEAKQKAQEILENAVKEQQRMIRTASAYLENMSSKREETDEQE